MREDAHRAAHASTRPHPRAAGRAGRAPPRTGVWPNAIAPANQHEQLGLETGLTDLPHRARTCASNVGEPRGGAAAEPLGHVQLLVRVRRAGEVPLLLEPLERGRDGVAEVARLDLPELRLQPRALQVRARRRPPVARLRRRGRRLGQRRLGVPEAPGVESAPPSSCSRVRRPASPGGSRSTARPSRLAAARASPRAAARRPAAARYGAARPRAAPRRGCPDARRAGRAPPAPGGGPRPPPRPRPPRRAPPAMSRAARGARPAGPSACGRTRRPGSARARTPRRLRARGARGPVARAARAPRPRRPPGGRAEGPVRYAPSGLRPPPGGRSSENDH